MIPRECKRLAEVDFPIAVVSRYAAEEKAIRSGLPSTIHLWWARRPLAACRAMLLGLLLPDPCDKHCPPEFKKKARELFVPVPGIAKVGSKDEDLREALLKFIGDFSNWDLAADRAYLEVAHGLVKAAHPEETPLVVDPFAGGGAIPLEALRLGCETFASDLNPVACLVLKVMLEDVPRRGADLAENLRRVGTQLRKAVEKELAEFYPVDPDKARPIAYLWARTVRCESPDCGAEIPLIRSFWLCKKPKRKRALRPRVVRHRKSEPPKVELETFEPATDNEVRGGTVNRAKATCLCCNTVLAPDRVRAQLREQRGGADVIFDEKGNRMGGARLLAVVTLQPGESGRCYRFPSDRDYKAVWKAVERLKKVAGDKLPGGLNPVPDEATPAGGGSGAGRAFSYHKYGMMSFQHLFTSRQNLSLVTLARTISQTNEVQELLALALGKLVDLANAICRWEPVNECPRNVFAAGRVKAAWEFAEGVPISESSGSISVCIENLIGGIQSVGPLAHPANLAVAAAQTSPLSDSSTPVWFTDPPYYDAYPYADLADTFFVWLKRALVNVRNMHDPFDPTNPLTPKRYEATHDESRKVDGQPKDRSFFEGAMAACFKEGRRILEEQGIGCIVFAHKTTEGWEALLSGIISGGLTITGSWPIATEQAHRLRAKESAALATSVHLVCRPRPEGAPTGDWGEILRELPRRVREWMERLQSEGVRGADLVFACIGPALEIFSRYSRVETAEGKEIKLDEFLLKVWEVVGRTALEQVLGTAEARARNRAANVLEEDARLTALFLWTLQSTAGVTNGDGQASEGDEEEVDEAEDEEEAPRKKTKGFTLIFDVVRRFAQPLGIHLPDWERRIIEIKKGVVRLLPVSERAQQLFGEEGASAVADRIEIDSRRPQHVQLSLFPDEPPVVKARKGGRKKVGANVPDESLQARREATTLDRVHAAMLLQASGRANALRALLKAEQERGSEFLRLANALSALYPAGSEEKRLLDAMLLAMPK
jgi:adenine-specific DNA methylase